MSYLRIRPKIIAYLSSAGEKSAAEILKGANVSWVFSFYPVLHGLERDGIIKSRWEDENGPYPRRRVYRLTKATTNEKPRRVG